MNKYLDFSLNTGLGLADGSTEANCMGYNDFLADVWTGNTYLAKGSRTEPAEVIGHTSEELTIHAWDPTNPWRFSNTHTSSNFSVARADMKDGMLYSYGGLYPSTNPSDPQNYLTNMHYESNDQLQAFASFTIKGCTLLCPIIYLTNNSNNANPIPTTVFKDSVLVISNNFFRGNSYDADNFNHAIFDNCVFGSAVPGYSATLNNCQNVWTPPTFPPVIGSVMEDFLYDTLGTGITVLGSGSYTGYELGLFGGAARASGAAVGAFWFGAGTSATPGDLAVTVNGEPVTSVSYLEDGDKKLMYMLFVDADQNLMLNKIRDGENTDEILGTGATEA